METETTNDSSGDIGKEQRAGKEQPKPRLGKRWEHWLNRHRGRTLIDCPVLNGFSGTLLESTPVCYMAERQPDSHPCLR